MSCENLGGKLITDLFIGLAVVVGALFAVVKFYPQLLAGILDEKLLASLGRGASDTSSQPLTKIFLGFNHDSVDAWIEFTKTKELEDRRLAYDNLVSYLTVSPNELGSVTGDIIKAVAALGLDESFDHLAEFIANLKDHASVVKTLGIYYEQAANALVKLDSERALPTLLAEIYELKANDDTLDLQIVLIEAISSLDPGPALSECWLKILVDASFLIEIKERIIKSLVKLDEDKQVDLIIEVNKYIIEKNLVRDNVLESDKTILSYLFPISITLISKGHELLWLQVLNLLEDKLLKDFYAGLIKDFIYSSDASKLSDEYYEQLLSDPEISKFFREALSEKQGLSNEEFKILRRDFTPDEFNYSSDVVKIEKFSKTKSVSKEFLDNYHFIDNKIIKETDGSKTKRKNVSLNILSGKEYLEKIYLLTRIAANLNMHFIYVNTLELLGSLTELAKFKTNINNHKPCVVYFDNFNEALSLEFNKTQANNFKTIAKNVIELSATPNIKFFANIKLDQEEVPQEVNDKIVSFFKGRFDYVLDLNYPAQEIKNSIMNEYISAIKPQRIKDKTPLTEMVVNSNQSSTLEFVDLLKTYLERALLIKGEINVEQVQELAAAE